ncbi:MAG: hypothetical protein ACRELT_01445, partial [Longimicrobiales bacterium]
GHNTVTCSKPMNARAGGNHNASAAVSQWKRLLQLRADGVQDGPETICSHLFDYTLHLIRTAARLLQQTRPPKFHS